MPENRPDEFAKNQEENPSEQTSPIDEIIPEADLPLETTMTEPGAEAPVSDGPAQPAEQPAPTPESMLPPEAQGEANGGPLGCCLGTMVGLLLSLSLAILSRAYATELASVLQGNYWLLGLIVRIAMGIMAFACAIFFGYLGWKLGKRFYREYEPPVQKRRSKAKKQHQRT